MSATILIVAFAFGQAQPEKAVSDAEKKEFLKLLAKLPSRGEFFTEEAVQKALPYTRILLALTQKDLERHDIYPFLALSSGLMGHKEARQYAIANFSKIAHPTIKLGWAIALFRDTKSSSEILSFLRNALESKDDARTLSAMLGPGFEEFRDNVIRTHEIGRQLKVEQVKQHSTLPFPKYGGGFDYTNSTYVCAPGPIVYAVRRLNQQGELITYDLAKGTTSRRVVPQPKEFKPNYDFPHYFGDPVLSFNSRGDLLCRWTIEGNGDHALAMLKKGTDSFVVKRVRLYLGSGCVVTDSDGAWYLIQGAPDFKVYQIDNDLKLTRLGSFTGKGHHSTHILDARFISSDTLHLFWGDVLSGGNHLRMRCIDFDVKKRTWLHNREIFKLDEFVSSANEPTVLKLKDDSLHYLWRIDEGANRGEATGLYYQAEAESKSVKVANGYHYRAIAVGHSVVVCYTLLRSPDKVYFRVLHYGAPGPVTELTVAKGREHNLQDEYMALYAETDRIWFVNTLAPNTLYELKLVDMKQEAR
jgi:hypothetical protein